MSCDYQNCSNNATVTRTYDIGYLKTQKYSLCDFHKNFPFLGKRVIEEVEI